MACGHCHFYKVQPGLWVSIPAEYRTRTRRIEDRWPVCIKVLPQPWWTLGSSRIILKRIKVQFIWMTLEFFYLPNIEPHGKGAQGDSSWCLNVLQSLIFLLISHVGNRTCFFQTCKEGRLLIPIFCRVIYYSWLLWQTSPTETNC